jgi:histidinol dehydrogenase
MTAPTAIRRLNAADPDFAQHLDHLLSWESVSDDSVNQRVLDIIKAVRERGDAALVEFTQRFDGLEVASMADLILPRERLELALTRITAPSSARRWKSPRQRVRSYHEKQKQDSWSYTEADGTVLGQKVTPLDRAGLYVPGGKASYPSSVLMNAIPAKVAGVTEVVMVVPTPRGELNELVLAAACIAGVDRVFTIGGAQAVAALAYGTESVPKVDKVVGPGNIYVATAKRHVFGQVGIDMIAGPSEILVVCDGQTDPDWIAMDLFSQAEHDEDAQAILVSPDAAFLDKVAASIAKAVADHGARRDHQHLDQRPWRADSGGRHAAGHRRGQPYCPGTPWSCRLPIPRRGCRRFATPVRSSWVVTLQRSAGRLLRGPQPRVADLGHGAFLLAVGGV